MTEKSKVCILVLTKTRSLYIQVCFITKTHARDSVPFLVLTSMDPQLTPILSLLRSTYPDISTVYFVSDGPTTQYRCKANFYLLSTLLFDWGFKVGNWSFLEAGHEKGPADGIGGSVKRSGQQTPLSLKVGVKIMQSQ